MTNDVSSPIDCQEHLCIKLWRAQMLEHTLTEPAHRVQGRASLLALHFDQGLPHALGDNLNLIG